MWGRSCGSWSFVLGVNSKLHFSVEKTKGKMKSCNVQAATALTAARRTY